MKCHPSYHAKRFCRYPWTSTAFGSPWPTPHVTVAPTTTITTTLRSTVSTLIAQSTGVAEQLQVDQEALHRMVLILSLMGSFGGLTLVVALVIGIRIRLRKRNHEPSLSETAPVVRQFPLEPPTEFQALDGSRPPTPSAPSPKELENTGTEYDVGETHDDTELAASSSPPPPEYTPNAPSFDTLVGYPIII